MNNPKLKSRKFHFKSTQKYKIPEDKLNKRSARLNLWKLQNIAERNFKRNKLYFH